MTDLRLSKHFMRLVLKVFMLALAVQTLHGQTVASFALHTFGTVGCRVSIETEDSLLVPSLENVALTEDVLSRIVPYRGSDQANETIRELLTHKELSLGDTSVFFYLGVAHALDRIYRNRLLGQESQPREEWEKKLFKELDAEHPGMSSADQDKLLVNLRELASIKLLKDRTLKLRVFSSKQRFLSEAAAVGLHSAVAYWDQSNATIGVYFDFTVFKWFKARHNRGTTSPAEGAVQVRDYVFRQCLDVIGHELVHFVQGQILIGHPFLAEASALIVQSNLSMREETARLTGEQLRRGVPASPSPNSSCWLIMDLSPPMFSSSLIQFQRGLAAAEKGMPPSRLLRLSESEFYSQSPQSLKSSYDVALAFATFAASLPEDRFQFLLRPFIRNEKLPSTKDLEKLDIDFKQWAVDHARDMWESPTADQLFASVSQLTDYCLNERQYAFAYIGSQIMYTLHPSSPTPFLYAGDVFFNADVPFFAFDFYTRSDSWRRQFGLGDESEVRLDSRLGDAFEIVGDSQSADEWFSRVAKASFKTVPETAVLPYLRTKLKHEFYRRALEKGFAHEEFTFLLAESYAKEFNVETCASGEIQKNFQEALNAAQSGDSRRYRDTLDKSYNLVVGEIISDFGSDNFSDIVAHRFKHCQTVNQ